mgnify:CR=1 FL=1
MSGVLTVRVIQRGEVFTPRLAYTYDSQASPEPSDAYARTHDLTAAVWRAQKGQPWEVRPATGRDERGRLYCGAEVVLDTHTFEAAERAQAVLARLALAMGAK